MHYHLTQHQRIELSLLLRLGHSHRGVAQILGVSPSTVSRELKRNGRASGNYHATSARLQARDRRAEANAEAFSLLLAEKGEATANELMLR